MAVLLQSPRTRASEGLAFKLQEEAILAKLDDLLAQRIALYHACTGDGDAETLDIEAVLRATAAMSTQQENSELEGLQALLSEVRSNIRQVEAGMVATVTPDETRPWGPSSSAPPAVLMPDSSSSSAVVGPGTECQSCFDTFPKSRLICAGADSASSSTAFAGCGHFFCPSCLSEYVRGAVRERKFPIGCPMAPAAGGQQQEGCKAVFSRGTIESGLEGQVKEMQVYNELEVLHTIDPALRIHCPHKSCSALQLRPDPADVPEDGFTSCYHCNRAFCINCMIPGLHAGYTCAAFQALPAHLRSAEDAAMLQLSERQRWKTCPQCKEMVEKNGGCNHMRCRCGNEFCYACGAQYNRTAGARDLTKACRCRLFDAVEARAGANAGAVNQLVAQLHISGGGGSRGEQRRGA